MSLYNLHSMTKNSTFDASNIHGNSGIEVDVKIPTNVSEKQKKLTLEADVLIEASKVYQDSGDLDKAWQKIEEALALLPRYWQALLSKSIILEKQGRLEESFVTIQEAYNANPNSHLTNYNFARMYLMGSKDYPEILKLIHKALEIKPDFFEAYFLLSVVYSSDKQMDEAVKYANKALEIQPDNTGLLLNKVDYLLALEKKDEAIEILENMADSNDEAKAKLNELR